MFFTIKLYLNLNCVLMLNWIVWNRTIIIKMDLALNNLQSTICHKTQKTNQPSMLWHNGWHSFLWVWVWVPVRGSLCLFWRETNTKGLRAIFPTRPEEDKGRQGPRAEQGSQLERAVNRSRGKPTASTCGPRGRACQHERMSQCSWWLCGNFARKHACNSSQKHRMLRKCHKLLPSCAWS